MPKGLKELLCGVKGPVSVKGDAHTYARAIRLVSEVLCGSGISTCSSLCAAVALADCFP